jgi:nicotinate phosphoribosyltransferase
LTSSGPSKRIRLVSEDGLLLIHPQNDFLPGGSLAVPRANEILPILNKYLEIFEQMALPIVFTRDWHPPDHCSFQEQGGTWPVHCVAGSEGARFSPMLRVPESALVFSGATNPDREAYSGFDGTDLDQSLKMLKVRHLYIGGLATDYCVFNTVKDALKLGYSVTLLLDAMRPVDIKPGDGKRAIESMKNRGAKSCFLQNLAFQPPRPSALAVDLYQLTMLQGYFDQKMEESAVFEFFIRRLPKNRSFLIFCGLDPVLDYLETLRFSHQDLEKLKQCGLLKNEFIHSLKTFRFTGDVDAMPEGTAIFSGEPCLRVTAPLSQCQFIETMIINFLQYQILVATKAARMILTAKNKILIDFGLRRAHSAEAGYYAARASYIAGFAGTATLNAGLDQGIPVYGTMAHSFIQAHDSEINAFRQFARSHPGNIILLLDTYDYKKAAISVVKLAKELKEKNITIKGIRLDSGNLAQQAKTVRKILDQGGLKDVRIYVSGDLDEYALERLELQKAPIDGYGIGTRLATASDSPYLECAYKLQNYAGRPICKLSPGKSTLPGIKQVYRRYTKTGSLSKDEVALVGEPCDGNPLLQPVMRDGKRLHPPFPLAQIRTHTFEQLAKLPAKFLKLKGNPKEPVYFSAKLKSLKTH